MNTEDPSSVDPDEHTTGAPVEHRRSGRREQAETQPWLAHLCEQSTWASALTRGASRLADRWRRPRLWIGGGVLLAVLLALLAYLAAMRPTTPQRTAPDTMTFYISARPTLIFAHGNGSVHVTSGPDGQVSITESRNGITDVIATHYAQHGDAVVVTVDIPSGLYLDTWVDFTVRIPRQAGLSIAAAAGTIVIDGIRGNIALSDTNGSIWATNLGGSVALKTASGSINTDHVIGQVDLATQNGTITSTNTQLTGHSTVRAESGTINFHGSLGPHGYSEFSNTNGAIGLTLPSNSAFSVDARTRSGSITVGFPGVTHSQRGGNEARGVVGAPPRARLTIGSTSGSIDVLQGG